MVIHWSTDVKISEHNIFPCDYPIKILCKNRSGLFNEIVKCVSKHDLSFIESSARK